MNDIQQTFRCNWEMTCDEDGSMNTLIRRSCLISVLIVTGMLFIVIGRAQAIPVPVAFNVAPAPLGSNWEQTRSGGVFPTFELVPIGVHKFAILFDDNSTSVFDVSFEPSISPLIPIQFLNAVVYTPRPGTTGTLQSFDQPFFFTGGAPGTGEILDFGFEIFDPDIFTFTSAAGERVLVDTRTLPNRAFQVTEPGAIGIVAMGLMGLGFLRRRKAATNY